MKATDSFKAIIQNHLEKLAKSDSLFAVTFTKAAKNIDDCVTYIMNTVQKSGCNGFADAEIFGMAVHYYDEDKIEVGKPNTGKVVVNHHASPDEAKPKTANPSPTPVPKAKPIVAVQTSLFG